ncbi:MAG: hypothetical protein JWP82_2439 [Humibacillus sp.]|nr:hypothetical protein [Humibacillus sp.]
MSQMTATARPLRAPRRGPAPVSALRVLPARMASSGNGAFAALCIVLLTTGLIALLVLNTALAQGSLVLGSLNRDSARLADAASNLQEEIDVASASGALARSAAQLGMVRMGERGYIDLASGAVTGEAQAATKEGAFPIVSSPTPPAVAADVKSVLSSATSVAAKAKTSAEKSAAAAQAAAKAAEKAAARQAAATPSGAGAASTSSGAATLGTGAGTSARPSQSQPSTTR